MTDLKVSSQDFAQFVDLQQQHTHFSTKLAELEVRLNKVSQSAIAAAVPEFVVLQEEATRLETQIKDLFAKHPEWRDAKKKSVGTPYGSVEQRASEELDIPNEAMTVALIEATGKADPNFKAADFLHIEKLPNREALERLGDDALTVLGVSRVKKETITVKPAKVNVAKAVKAAKPKQAVGV